MTERRQEPRRREHAVAPPPPTRAMRLLLTATIVAIIVGFLSAGVTLLGPDAAHPASGGAADPGAVFRGWLRLSIAVAVAVLWPLLLLRLRRGNARIYPRIRNVSVAIGAMLILITLASTESLWSHV